MYDFQFHFAHCDLCLRDLLDVHCGAVLSLEVWGKLSWILSLDIEMNKFVATSQWQPGLFDA